MYASVALLVVAFVLPSALRPPPGTTVSGSEYSPNAPPNAKAQTVIKTEEQAGSVTAGQQNPAVGGKAGPGATTTTTTTLLPEARAATTTTVPQASLFGCGPGNPPLQWPSVYAVPCQPAFTGNNGGATGVGVSATQINVVVSYYNQNGTAGALTPVTSRQNNYDRTLFDLATYFNAHAEMYNRTIQLYYATEASEIDSESKQISDVDTAYASYHPIAALVAGTQGEINEYAKFHVITDQFEQLNQPALAADAPYAWGQNSPTEDAELTAEFVCKEIKGGAPLPGVTTGNPGFNPAAPRTFGAAEIQDPGYNSGPELLSALSTCGITPVDTTMAALDEKGDEQAMLKLKDSNVTTVILNSDILDEVVDMAAANSIGYYPEWITTGYGLLVDYAPDARDVPTSESDHLFGLSESQINVAESNDECFKAVASVDPGFTADVTTCHVYWEMMNHLVDAIQLAGPKLNSDRLAAAYQEIPQVTPTPANWWAMSGTFADPARERSWADSASVYWWDANAPDADGNNGTFAYADCGERYYAGELPSRPAHIFTKTGYVTGLTFGHCTT